MVIEEKNVVTLTYDLRETDKEGELLERTDKENPLTFLFGVGQLLPSFEEKLRGLSQGDRFAFSLSPEEAYGESIPDNIIDIPMANFQIEGEVPSHILQEGNYITMQDNYGREHLGKVLTFDEENVKVDFNHVMAGKTLHFEGSIEQVRQATEDELSHGHVHPQDGEGGHSHH